MIRFSELVSALSPTQYTELALLLFFLVFAAVAIRESSRGRGREHASWARMPLDDDEHRGDRS